jgi:hypothetical protein
MAKHLFKAALQKAVLGRSVITLGDVFTNRNDAAAILQAGCLAKTTSNS